MSQRFRSFLLILSLLQFLASKGQTNLSDYSVVNYNSDNALPQNSIKGMTFDRNGFLWLATEMGVVRFDGRNFREYNMDNSPAMLANRCFIYGLADGSGKVVIHQVAATHHMLTVTADYQLEVDSLRSADPYEANRLNNRVFSFAKIYKKWGGATGPAAYKRLLKDLDHNGDVFTVNEKQAYVRIRKDSIGAYLDESKAEIHLLPEISPSVPKLEFMMGDVFISVDRLNRLYAYKEGRLQKNISVSIPLQQILSQAGVAGPYPIEATIKAITDTSHSFIVYKGNILLLHLRNGQLGVDTLAANTSIRDINCLIYDEENRILYVGTATSGLYILKKHQFGRLAFNSDNYAINSLYGQVELPDGRILTTSGVLDRHSPVNTPSPGVYDQHSFLRSSDGSIWYSSYDSLRRTDTGLHKTVTVAYMGGWLSCILEAVNKDILYSNPSKLYRLRGKDVTMLLDHPALLEGADILVVREMSPGKLWIGTSSGVFSYDMIRETLTRQPGLENASIRAIYKARDGSVWIGTYGQGFYKYEKGRFIKMPMDPMNNLATVHGFMEDRLGYFWLPTNKGLFRVAKKELDSYAAGNPENVFYYYFDKSSGFSSNEFNGGCTPCGIVTRDGHFSLPSLDGLIQFQPDSITIAPPDHPIFIDHILDNKKVSPGDRFEQDQHSGPVIFAVSSPYFGNPANLHLEYSIRELDDKWHPVNNDGRLVLTGLHKGQYTLIVRKQESYAHYSYSTAQWTVLPDWYETIWFRLLGSVVVISILPFIFWLRYNRQVKRAEQLEQKVAERTQALSESNRVKEKMIAIILHDLRSPLRFLQMLASHIYENYQKVTGAELGDMLFKFRNGTHDLYEFTQDFLVWSNAQQAGFVVRREEIALRPIVAEIVSLYEPGADLHNNVVLNLVPEDFTLVSDTHILKLLIRNLTDNANKYTEDGVIRIEAVQDNGATRITITDTGASMRQELVTAILTQTYEAENNGSGFGYKIILELLGRIEGELAIDTPAGAGNRISLLFKSRHE